MANRIELIRLNSQTPQSVREDRHVGEESYAGVMFFGPEVGMSFSFFRDDKEYMHTSKVANIEFVGENEMILTTQNSQYKLKIGASQEPI